MSNEYMIVHKDVLPKCFELVAKAKELLKDGKIDNVSDACKSVGISRSTFYKYQDYVFFYDNKENERKLSFSLSLSHEAGALSKVCGCLSKLEISIITISQSAPLGDVAEINVTCDVSKMSCGIDELKKKMENIEEVSRFNLLSFEN